MNEVQAIKDKRQIEKIKAVLKRESFRDYLLFVMGINTGLRVSDLIRLKISDVTDEKGNIANSVKVKEQKTNKTKTFFLNDTVKKAVAEYLKTVSLAGDLYLFRSRKGENKPITRVQAYRILNNACNLANVNGSIGTHTMRKTFGYWAYKQGIDITLLMRIFNHSTPGITLRYIGITQDEINNVYVNLNL